MSVPDFESMFTAGTGFRGRDGAQLEIEVLEAGRLTLRSGRVVACDPGFPIEKVPSESRAAVTIAPGRYPVSLSVARARADPPITMVCGARIQVSDDPVERWTPAREKVADDGSVTAQGFVVDSGLACLLDDDAIPIVTRLNHDEDAFDRFANELLSRSYGQLEDESTGLNLIAMVCGMGDGAYPVWLGATRVGSVAQIMVDLEVLSHCSGPTRPN